MDAPDWSGVLTVMLSQPTEIITRILEDLSIRDLFSLRQVSHRFHALVHEHEMAISTSASTVLQRRHPSMKLSVRVHGPPRDLMYYADLQRRFRLCWDLSRILTAHLISHLSYGPINDKESLESMRKSRVKPLGEALLAAIFSLNNFLDCMRLVVAEGEKLFATWDDETLIAATDIFMLDQQQIIQELCPSPESVKDLALAWIVLQGVCKSRRLGLNLRSPTYPFATLKKIILYGGLDSMHKLLTSSQDVAVRRNLLKEVSDSMQVVERRHPQAPLESIHHLVERSSVPPAATLRAYKVMNKFIDNQDILSRAAFAILQRHGEADHTMQYADPARWIASKICLDGEDPAQFVLTGWATPG